MVMCKPWRLTIGFMHKILGAPSVGRSSKGRPSMGRHTATQPESPGGGCAKQFLRLTRQGTYGSGGGGSRAYYLCDPGSELRLGGSKIKEGQENMWDGQ